MTEIYLRIRSTNSHSHIIENIAQTFNIPESVLSTIFLIFSIILLITVLIRNIDIDKVKKLLPKRKNTPPNVTNETTLENNNILDYVNKGENAENKYMAQSSIPNSKLNNKNNKLNIKKLIILIVALIAGVIVGTLIYKGVIQHSDKEDQGIVTGISLKGTPLNLNKTTLEAITVQYPIYENQTDFMNARASRGLVKDNSGLNADITQSYYLYDNNETQMDIKNKQEEINGNQYNHYHDLAEPLLDTNGQYVPKEVEVEGILYFDANGILKQLTINYQNRHNSYLALQSDTNKITAQRKNKSNDELSYEETQTQYHNMKVNEIASTVESNTNDAECFAIEDELVVVKPKDLTNYIAEPNNFFRLKIKYYDIYGKKYV